MLTDKWIVAKRKLGISTIQLTNHMKPKKKDDHTKVWMLQSTQKGEENNSKEVDEERDLRGREEGEDKRGASSDIGGDWGEVQRVKNLKGGMKQWGIGSWW